MGYGSGVCRELDVTERLTLLLYQCYWQLDTENRYSVIYTVRDVYPILLELLKNGINSHEHTICDYSWKENFIAFKMML